jgi:tetratricopeptide (TPR) repeat protein
MRAPLTPVAGLPVADMQQIDAACDRFEAAWRAGERPRIEAFLCQLSGPTQPRLFHDLLDLEIDLRVQSGEQPDRRFYHNRFPQHEDIIDAVFAARDGSTTSRPRSEILGSPKETVERRNVDDTYRFQFDGGSKTDPECDEAAQPTRRVIAGYEILGELGRGGMGVVHRARQTALGRLVALKLIRSAEFATTDELSRFQNEAEAVARLDHPHIVPIYEVGQHRGLRFFSMKLIAGVSLDKNLAFFAADFAASARLVAIIAEAVHHAHQRGILHRDLKPANILLDEDGKPHVTDFGLARRIENDSELTQSGMPMGTPSYMSPEQARGERGAITTATDVYGLGSILYALLTGQAPFAGSSLAETLDRVRGEPARPPSRLNGRVPRDLEIICLKCLEKDPDRRYASARALADDLNRWLGGEPIQARPVGPATRSWMWCRRHPLPAALAGLLVLAVLTGLAGITWKWREAARASLITQKVNTFFIQKLLAQASPRFNPRGAGLTIAELLDRTSAQLGREFDGEPEVEAEIRETLGSTYHSLALYDQARPHLEAAIKLNTQLHGPRSRAKLREVNLLTALLDEAGQPSEAEPLMRRNLDDCASSLGRGDPITLDAEYQLGAFLRHSRQLDEAERLLRHNLQARRRVLGSQHPDTLRSVNQLGLLLQEQGNLAEAEALSLEYEHGIQCLWGTKHPDNVVAITNRGQLRLYQGQFAEALLLYQRAADEASRIFGADHPQTVAAVQNHARVLKEIDRRKVVKEELSALPRKAGQKQSGSNN